MNYTSDEHIYKIFRECKSVCTDSRKIESGCLFFALKGPNFDGNNFAKQALKEGAAYAVVDDSKLEGSSDRFLFVKNCLITLQKIANLHRRGFNIPVIAITGSNGKTTTKELIGAVLAKKYNTLVTQGNLNNHIGVPLTLLKLRETHEIAVIETGANHIGEIAELCKIAEPTHGLITNIGKAHIEGFGGVSGIIKGKGELYDYLSANGGTVFVNSSNEILTEMIEQRSFREIIKYPQENDYINIRVESTTPFIHYKNESGDTCSTHLFGKHNFENIAAALCTGKFFGIPEHSADEAVMRYVPQNNRSQIIKKDSNTVIPDAYNANPDSMKAAITAFAEMNYDHKVLILGDMFELGDTELSEHERLLHFAGEFDFDRVMLCGKLFYQLRDAFDYRFFRDLEQVKAYLKNHSFRDTAFLLKGSRGMQLEKLINIL